MGTSESQEAFTGLRARFNVSSDDYFAATQGGPIIPADPHINWRWEYGTKPNGVPTRTKVPYDVTRRHRINAHNPNNWLSYDEARKRDPEHVATVLTGDGLTCLDVDGCLAVGAWDKRAVWAFQAFPGAA